MKLGSLFGRGLVAACVIAKVAADSGEDVSNNLFSDLAPLLSLFGEQFAKQFMSQSMGWLDHIIFAMAPLGILTAIVSAIRVGGPPWLRAVVGRARENRATVEMELMSSTSHEVCELWNGEGIVRSMGKPQIAEIVYIESKKDDPETFGFYTLDSALKEGLLREDCNDFFGTLLQRILRRLGDPDVESTPITKEPGVASDRDGSAANIFLNSHGGSDPKELFVVAMFGIALQFGMLAFTGLSVYHPSFRLRFAKDDSPVQDYAYPLMAVGTVVLVIGMCICSAVVEKSTVENRYVLTDNSKRVSSNLHGMRIMWIQKSHTVSDQTFDSYFLAGPTVSSVLTSRRRPRKTSQGNKRSNDLLSRIASTPMERATLVAVFFGLVGFVLQFEGLRGMNWSASVAQLICITLMTILRAWVRRGLIASPIAIKLQKQHEIDLVALRFAKDGSAWLEAGNGCPMSDLRRNSSWKVKVDSENLAYTGTTGDEVQNSGPLEWPQKAFKIRRHLQDITAWSGNTSRLSVAVAESINVAMNTLFADEFSASNSFQWHLAIHSPSTSNEISIQLFVRKRAGSWAMNPKDIEAALSLWGFCYERQGTNEGREDSINPRPKRKIVRILGLETCLRDIKWWIGDVVDGDEKEDSSDKVGDSIRLGFAGVKEEGLDSDNGEIGNSSSAQVSGASMAKQHHLLTGPLTHTTDGSLDASLAQHLFSSFMWAISASYQKSEQERDQISSDQKSEFSSISKLKNTADTSILNREVFIADNPGSLLNLRLESRILSGVANAIQQTGLGSLQEAYMCIIPPLSSFKLLPLNVVPGFIRQKLHGYEVQGRWRMTGLVYVKLFEEHKTLGTEHPTLQRITAYLISFLLNASGVLQMLQKELRDDESHKLANDLDAALEALISHENTAFLELFSIFKAAYAVQSPRYQQLESLKSLTGFVASSRAPPGRRYPPKPGSFQSFPDDYSLRVHLDFATWIGDVYVPQHATAVQIRDVCGRTVLHYAVVGSENYLVNNIVIQSECDTNATDFDGWTPLHYALEFSTDETKLKPIISTLLQYHASIKDRHE